MEWVRKTVARFEASQVEPFEDEEGFYFTDCPLSACSPVFDHLSDNYELAEELIQKGVITEEDEDDSESGQLFVNFKTLEQGVAFIGRLNAYLEEREKAIEDAYPNAFYRRAYD